MQLTSFSSDISVLIIIYSFYIIRLHRGLGGLANEYAMVPTIYLYLSFKCSISDKISITTRFAFLFVGIITSVPKWFTWCDAYTCTHSCQVASPMPIVISLHFEQIRRSCVGKRLTMFLHVQSQGAHNAEDFTCKCKPFTEVYKSVLLWCSEDY